MNVCALSIPYNQSQATKRLNFSESVSASAIKPAMKSSCTVYRLDLEKDIVEPFHYLISNTKPNITFINAKLSEDGISRISLTIHVQLCKPLESEKVVVYFHTRMERFGREVIEDDYNHFVDQLISQLNIYFTACSGLVVESLLAVEIKVAAQLGRRETPPLSVALEEAH